MAARYCFVDYDREIAIVAEIKEGSSKPLSLALVDWSPT